MIVIVRCNDVVSDTRASKYIKYLEDTNQQYRIIGWDRSGVCVEPENGSYFKKQAGVNVGGFKAAKNRLLWMYYVVKTLCKLSCKEIIIHACDVDSAFPAAIYKSIYNKRTRIIFDIFDWFSASMSDQGRIILTAFNFMEKYTVKRSDYIIICEKERIQQIHFQIPFEKLYVLPNIPFFDDNSFLKKNDKFIFGNSKITFSYVGGFTKTRCLEEIITLAQKGVINLLIAGYGNTDIERNLQSIKCPNIKYYGPVKYSDGLNIMYNADIVYAMYSKVVPNHIYAAPNKFYEALFLGKPIFTTEGTIVANKVKEFNTGFSSEESLENIEAAIKNIKYDEIILRGNMAAKLWEDKYKNYTLNFMLSCYQKMLNSAYKK